MLTRKTPERRALAGGTLFSNWRLTRKILREVSEGNQSQNSVRNFVCPLWAPVHSSDAIAARLAIGLWILFVGHLLSGVLFLISKFSTPSLTFLILIYGAETYPHHSSCGFK